MYYDGSETNLEIRRKEIRNTLMTTLLAGMPRMAAHRYCASLGDCVEVSRCVFSTISPAELCTIATILWYRINGSHLHRQYRGQSLVLDPDQLRGSPRSLDVLGDDAANGLTDHLHLNVNSGIFKSRPPGGNGNGEESVDQNSLRIRKNSSYRDESGLQKETLTD
ncbi:hypothetical protein PRIPAC_75263 [Pristionchus pacificus]|uniref:Uncharacterized protein n=1 Tax=Pristionchus pacificus TaxID=54126 RepID=A0A2A6B4E2_PRIPA|nr:hypothetical protein PRIPAC_75263 [Pristionchus pacificus]|eukprot:PDM60731.1 hypothetical protein PRIPAC_54537 [Pristionchus pacificus]